jgi:hypothetical protein
MKFEINTQLRMRIIHNWKVEWIFRLFKAIISIYSITQNISIMPVEGYGGSTAYAGNVKEAARREICAETFYDAF